MKSLENALYLSLTMDRKLKNKYLHISYNK
jgi:hypothetical protein